MSFFYESIITAENWGFYSAIKNISQEDPEFPATNVLVNQPRRTYQTINETECSLDFEVPARLNVNNVGILFGNIHNPEASYRLRFANSEAEIDSNPLVDTSSPNPNLGEDFSYCIRTPGQPNQAMDASSLQDTNLANITIEFMFRVPVLTNQAIASLISGSSGILISMNYQGFIHVELLSSGTVIAAAVTSPGIWANTWYRLSVTYTTSSGGQLKAYVNANLAGQDLSTGPISGSDCTFQLGDQEVDANYTSAAVADYNDVRIWDNVQSAAQIAANWATRKTDSNLVHNWMFDEGSGSSAANRGVNANTLSIHSSCEWMWPSRYWASPNLLNYDRTHGWYFSLLAILCSYMRLEVKDDNNSDGFLSIGRVFIGNGWRPSLNIEYGSGLFGFTDQGSSQTARNGVTFLKDSKPTGFLPFSIRSHSKAEVQTFLYEMARTKNQPVMMMRDPSDDDFRHNGLHYGPLQGNIEPIEESFELYRTRMLIKDLD